MGGLSVEFLLPACSAARLTEEFDKVGTNLDDIEAAYRRKIQYLEEEEQKLQEEYKSDEKSTTDHYEKQIEAERMRFEILRQDIPDEKKLGTYIAELEKSVEKLL